LDPRPDDMSQNGPNLHHSRHHSQKKQNPKPIFFIADFKSFEGLNSSLAQSTEKAMRLGRELKYA